MPAAGKRGRAIHSMAREMGMNYSTVQGWLARMHPGNLDRRFDRKSTGRRRVVPAAVLKYVEKLLDCSPQKYKFEAGSWQINMVMELVMKKFGMTFNPYTLKRGHEADGILVQQAQADPGQVRIRRRTGKVQAGDCRHDKGDRQAGLRGARLRRGGRPDSGLTQNTGGAVPAGTIPSDRDSPKNPRN